MYVDLHIHTNASDGTWSRAELLDQVSSKGIGLFSVTDHDTTENSIPMIQDAKENGIRYLPGVEVAATLRRHGYHMTCYGTELEDVELQALLERNRDARKSENDETIQRLAESDHRVDYDRYERYSYDRSRGGWKALNFLLDEGIIADLREFLQVYEPLGIKAEFAHPDEVIKVMRRGGGVPVLAHPRAHGGGGLMPTSELEEWVEFGIEGIECYFPGIRSERDSDAYVRFCKKRRLLVSGGSDCHGPFITRELGVPPITSEMIDLDALLERAGVPSG